MHGYARNDGTIVLEQGSDERRLSLPQIRILLHLATQPDGTAVPHVELHQVLWPGQLTPLTATQRASLSRSLRRMEEAGWVQRTGPTVVQLGKYGGRLVEWLRGWRLWAEYQATWLTTENMAKLAPS